MHEKKIALMYLRELMGALALYALILVLTIKFGRPMDHGWGVTSIVRAWLNR